MPILSKDHEPTVAAEIGKRTFEGNGFEMLGDFRKFLEPYTRLTMRDWGISNWTTAPIPYCA